MRGQAHLGGLHTFRISSDGLHVYPRLVIGEPQDTGQRKDARLHEKRLAMGVRGLDALLGGGLPSGYSLLVIGPSGSGKTILASAFLAEGAKRGEAGIFASFERSLSSSLPKSFDEFVHAGKITIVENRSLGLSIEEVLDDLIHVIDRSRATRIVIDSLPALELALAPEFRHSFHESVHRMVSGLTAKGVSVLLTAEQEDRACEHKFSLSGTAFLADALVALRYYEADGRINKLISIVKIRGSSHSNELRQYKITDDGIEIGEVVSESGTLLSGHATERGRF
jgi:circadian clock protein KaiC